MLMMRETKGMRGGIIRDPYIDGLRGSNATK